MEFNNSNITDFISGLISLGGGEYVEAETKLIVGADDKPRKLPLEDGTERQLAVYGTTVPNVIIINPFAEGEANSARNNWFYRSRGTLLALVIRKCIIKTLEVGERAHARKQSEEKNDKKFVKYLGKHAHACTAKALADFKKIASLNKPTEFFNIYYNKKKGVAEVKCNLFRDESKEIYPNISDTTWDALRAVTLKVLGVKDLEDYTYKPSSIDIPVLESFTNIMLQIFDNMKDIMKLCDIKNTETKDIRTHLSMLDAYHQRAKWCNSVSAVVPTAEIQKQEVKNAIPSVLGTAAPAVWNSGLPSAFGQPVQQVTCPSPQAIPAALGGTIPSMGAMPMMPAQPVSMTGVPAAIGQVQPMYAPQPVSMTGVPGCVFGNTSGIPAVLQASMFR